jgi:serine/threonine protein kinase
VGYCPWRCQTSSAFRYFLLCCDVLTVIFSAQHNILVDDDGTPRLADFCRSKLIGRSGFDSSTIAGCARQMAPELVPRDSEDDNPEELTESGDHKPPEWTKETDVYSFSMTAIEVSGPYNSK